jgi:bifunctional non-homologous end joining protein LigD
MRLPRDGQNAVLEFAEFAELGGRRVQVTNLDKPFWPELGITKRDLLAYYADVASLLLPHIHGRPMVMKRYPNGAAGDFFFMKRSPSPRPDWLATCAVEHGAGRIVNYPLIDDLPSLMWVVNLGCIDLNPFYARCDDVARPDVLHFDLDPGTASFDDVRKVALIVRDALEELGMRPLIKTSGGKGLHVYVAIVRAPLQHEVWTFAKALALLIASRHADLATADYAVAKRPKGRVLIDYNQNAWGRTLASIYSVRPTQVASVSTPITWRELERGVRPEDFRLDNVRARLAERGDLWAPLLASEGRTDLVALTARLRRVTAPPAPPRSPTAPTRRQGPARRDAPARRRARPR